MMWRTMAVGLADALLLASLGSPLMAQHPVENVDWTVTPLRTREQPVLPIFEGWYENQDGTRDLCFGYFNLNTEQSLDIALGPDNFIEPKRFDGGQPTYFEPQHIRDFIRAWCIFTVNVPEDFGAQDVVWTLRANGHEYSIPGRTKSTHYILDEPDSPVRERAAPLLRFEPDGPQGRGRNGLTAGPLTVGVGQPLSLNISVAGPDGSPRRTGIQWSKHQGLGDVTFSNQNIQLVLVEEEEKEFRGALGVRFSEGFLIQRADHEGGRHVTTTATFSEPGTYVLRVQAVDDTYMDVELFCCWTNGVVEVVVTP